MGSHRGRVEHLQRDAALPGSDGVIVHVQGICTFALRTSAAVARAHDFQFPSLLGPNGYHRRWGTCG
eukprot:3363470-Pyramimonas_sp.AAC.1